ncbi:MAG: hypothetical protein KAG66_12865, partial [Methylococcales bacterium]|nr:hypothetical protein [Methylococcales bacterium]
NTVKMTPDTLVAWNCTHDPGPVGPVLSNDCNAINASYCENMPPTMADVENIVKMNPTYHPMADSLCWFNTMADGMANMNSITATLGATLAGMTPIDAPDIASIDTFYVSQWMAGCQSHPTMVIVRVNASPMPIWALRGDPETTMLSGYETTGDTTICPGQPPINLADMVTDTLMGTAAPYASVANTTVLEWRFYDGQPGNGGVLIEVVDALPNGWPDPADPDYPVEVHPTSGTKTYYAEVMHKIDAFVDPECVASIGINVIVAPAPTMAAIPDVKVCSDDSFNIILSVADLMGNLPADFTYAVDVVVDGGLVPLGTSPLTSSLGIIPGGGLANHAYENKT